MSLIVTSKNFKKTSWTLLKLYVSIVFLIRLGSRFKVQGSRFGFRVSTGSPGRSCQFFFLNQNNIVLVKKQKSTGCNRVFGQVTPGFSLLYFFFNPLDSSLGSVRSQVDPAGRAGFQNYICESLAFFSTISLYI
jgi:hypothetical protein